MINIGKSLGIIITHNQEARIIDEILCNALIFVLVRWLQLCSSSIKRIYNNNNKYIFHIQTILFL